MTKKLVIVAALMTLCGGVMAQDESVSTGGGFFSGLNLNTNNKYQISLLLGNAELFNQDLSYVLPKYGDDNLGIGGNNAQSKDPGAYINLSNIGEGNILNMAGLQFAYYVTDGIDVNMSFGMDLRSTPKKDYVENVDVAGMNVQGSKWIEGRLQNNWIMSVGGNYHFTVSNEKIDLYAGLKVGYQHGQLTFNTPFNDKEYAYLTGSEVETLVVDGNGIPILDANGNLQYKGEYKDAPNESVLYEPRSGAGQVNCINTSIIAGVDYRLTDGLSFGISFLPYGFQYSMLEVCPKGARVYQAAHTANRFFANPMLKIGFRF